jgi:hypothetical protein
LIITHLRSPDGGKSTSLPSFERLGEAYLRETGRPVSINQNSWATISFLGYYTRFIKIARSSAGTYAKAVVFSLHLTRIAPPPPPPAAAAPAPVGAATQTCDTPREKNSIVVSPATPATPASSAAATEEVVETAGVERISVSNLSGEPRIFPSLRLSW